MNFMTHPLSRTAWELRWRVDDPRVSIGRGTYGDPKLILYSAHDRVIVGNYCSLAGGCTLLAGGEHRHDVVTSYPLHVYFGDDPHAHHADRTQVVYTDARYKGPLVIGSDVWVGYGAMIMSGVTIGHGAIIGAGAVVASDVPPYAIAIGNPWRLLRKRFDDAVIIALLRIRWWDWDPDVILEYRSLLLGDPRAFIEAVDRLPPAELASYFEVAAVHDRPPAPRTDGHTPAMTAKAILMGLCPPVVASGLRKIRRVMRNGDPCRSPDRARHADQT